MTPVQKITFDLETIPGESYPTPADIKVPASYKKEESINVFKNNPKNLEDAYKKQALSYIEGRIHTIAWKVDDDPTQVVFHDGTDEEGMFRAFEDALLKTFRDRFGTDTLHKVCLVGHNIRGFDLPFLWLRARKYDCSKLLKVIGRTPDDIDFEDTMMWSCVTDKYKGFASLDKACALFGLPGKSDFNGSMVYDAWKAGQNQKIADYGKQDVDKTYALAVALGIIV